MVCFTGEAVSIFVSAVPAFKQFEIEAVLKRQVEVQQSWYRAVTRSAAQIRKRFGVPDQATEERMVRAFRAALRPRKPAGRKPDEATARAAAMWTAGMGRAGDRDRRRYQHTLWQRIYREIFPDFHRMDKLTTYLTNLVRDYVEKSRIRKMGGCHLFRHTLATLMLENGADIRVIQEMLGHACLSTTEMYTRVSINLLKQIYQATHPAARMKGAEAAELLAEIDTEAEQEDADDL